jgi:hypothetical protein
VQAHDMYTSKVQDDLRHIEPSNEVPVALVVRRYGLG